MAETTSPDGTRQTPLTRALATIRTLRQRVDELSDDQPVAVVGIGLRLPGGIDTLDSYWEALAAGRDLVRPMPPHRQGPFAREWQGLPQRGGFLEEVLDFDAAFFGISPREARHLDPQHRMLLEVTWEAIENAALPLDRLADAPTGLYLGIMWQDYREWLAGDPDAYWTTGNGHNFAAGRVAHALGLTGPAMSVDTACSSSLVSVHLAVQALRRGECETAVAAGANLIMSPRSMRLVQETRSLASDGRCKAFDARADGFTRGEGCGALILKRLDHAVRDGDRVHAVIRGSAVNQDGRAGGFTAPNVLSQVSLLEKALEDARLEPADIGYVEAHGTGTSLGDPIEMEALATVLGRRNGGAPLQVGAVKTNLGHLESAAGVAGVVKAVLCLNRRRIPPLVHFRALNPRIDLSGTGIGVPAELTDWSPDGGRYAGVSSFGMSGTNAHVVLGAPDAGPGDVDPACPEGFRISAKTPAALAELAGRYADRLETLDPADYPAFVHTATWGRTCHEHVVRVSADSPAPAAQALRALAAGRPSSAVHAGDGPEEEAHRPRRVIDLPAYPWQRERYAPENPPAPGSGTTTPDPAEARQGTTAQADAGAPPPTAHAVVWQRLAAAAADDSAHLVLAGDDVHTLRLLHREARARGFHGTLLLPAGTEPDRGPQPSADGWKHGTLPTDAQDWAALWAGHGDAPTALVLAPAAVSLCGVEDTESAEVTDDISGADAGAVICESVSTAVTALAAAGPGAAGPRRAFVLTEAVRRVEEGDEPALGTHGTLHGLAPVLGLEAGAAWGGVVDLPADATAQDVGAAVDFVSRCAVDPAPGLVEDVAAVRGGEIHVPRLTAAAEDAPRLTVRADATYLVTGGLGAVGRELVDDLARRGARHLLLVGRTPRDRLRPEAAALLERLTGQGVRAVYRSDGCDTREALAAACTALEELPPVRGVLHAAGSARPAALTELTAHDFADALRGKATGAWWLHRAAREWPLDFFVVLSSVSALWGTEGYAAYSAANGALDALVAYRAAQGLPAVSLAYGPWSLDGHGMADDALRERSARMGVGALDAGAGRAALTEHAPGAERRVVACALDLPRLRRVMAALRPRGLFAAPAGSVQPADSGGEAGVTAEPSVVAELTALPEAARADAARGHVGRIVATQLGHGSADDIRYDVGFFDLGLDSIMAVDLAARLSEAFGRGVQVADVFDHPTVTDLAGHLLRPQDRTAQTVVRAGPRPQQPTAPSRPPAPAGVESPGVSPAEGEHEPVAVVGLAGRFPQADSAEELWELLCDGRDGITSVPADRWETASLGANRVSTDQGGFLRDIDRFDAAFFGIPSREAESLDPQQRLLLESAWHALEDAGIDPTSLRHTRTGVFVGVSYGEYARLLAQHGPGDVDAYYSTGTALNAVAGRLAFTLGLNGPAMAVDTACSSSLVALHLAVRSLRSKESDTVLAGGVNVLLDPTSWVAVSQAHMLSPDGRCRTFSADANGFVRAEGCGVLVLKRLSDARRDGDRVLAVIRGTAVNQDGASAGLTAPSGSAQEAMLAAALADAGTAGHELSYLEAHGTGTALGDPVELGAAWRVLGPGRRPGEPLHVGSVKSNIGHCESAAGIAAVVKTVLALRHGRLPANLHYREPNPHVDWAGMNVRVVDAPVVWRRGDRPRVAGVSGFGFTGTNAHVVLADAPDEASTRQSADAPADGSTVLLPLSAPDADGLERLTTAWVHHLEDPDRGDDVGSLAAAAAVGRAHFAHRRAVSGRDGAELLAALRAGTPAGATTASPRVAFLFSGQGSQYHGMGRELYETEPVFREVFDACDQALTPELGVSPAELLFHGTDKSAVDETRLTQPALVALETALAAQWASWGVTPAVVMGHSVGEIAAALHAGVMDIPTGMRLISARARLMQDTRRGAMLAVVAPEEQAAAWAGESGLDVAAVNGPESTVLSGEPEAVEALAARLKEQGVRARRLRVSHAFHSRLLEPVLDEFGAAMATMEFHDPAIPVVSNLTGRRMEPGEAQADYWYRHARRPVRFHDGARHLAELGVDICLEIGPDRTLVNLVKGAGLSPAGGAASSLRRGTGDRAALLAAARTLYLGGADLDWRGVYPDRGTPHRAVPRYPFACDRHWAPRAPSDPDGRRTPVVAAPPWGSRLHSPALAGRAWATERSTVYPAHLTDHRLYGTVSVPGASQTATVLSALGEGGEHVVVEDLHFPRPLVLHDGERYQLQVLETQREHGTRHVSVQSLVDPERNHWQEHLSARIVEPEPAHHGSRDAGPAAAPPDTDAFIAQADRRLSGADFYRHLRRLGYHLGPSFRWIGDAWIHGDEALVRFTEPSDPREEPARYEIHPGLLDSCLQSAVTFAVQSGAEAAEEPALAIPFSFGRLAFPGRPVTGEQVWGHIRARRHGKEDEGLLQVDSADLHIFDGDGATIVAIDDFRFRRADRALLERSLREQAGHVYELAWSEWFSADADADADAGPGPARHVALLGGDTPVGGALSDVLESRGHRVSAVSGSPAPGFLPEGVALILDARFAEPAPDADADAAQTAARSLADSLRAAPRHLPYAVLGTPGEVGAPVRETLWGMLASVEAEQAERRLLRVALAPGWNADVAAAALTRALDEEIPWTWLEAGESAARIARLIPCAEAADAAPAVVNGSALVTGGLGALGLSAAALLAARGVASLTLMARSAPDEVARGVIDRLTADGTVVHVVQGDVTDPADCARAVAVAGRDGALRTVLHLAGTTADGSFEQLTEEGFARVFDAKAHGADVLAAALAGHALDSLLLFSSASTVLGSAGQTNYAAANGYLNGLAVRLRSTGVPATSVAWGPWTSGAKEGLADTDGTQRAIARLGIRPLTDDEAAEGMLLALAGDRARLVAVAVDAQAYTAALRGHPRAALLQGAVPGAPRGEVPPDRDVPRRGWLRDLLTDRPAEECEERIRQEIRMAAADVLGGRVCVDDDLGFTEAGLDSIMIIDLRTRMSDALGTDLPATVAFDHPTVTQLAAHCTALLDPAPPGAEPEPDVAAPAAAPEESGVLEDLSFDELLVAVQADVADKE